MAKRKLLIDGKSLTLTVINDFINNNLEIGLTKTAENNIIKTRKLVD